MRQFAFIWGLIALWNPRLLSDRMGGLKLYEPTFPWNVLLAADEGPVVVGVEVENARLLSRCCYSSRPNQDGAWRCFSLRFPPERCPGAVFSVILRRTLPRGCGCPGEES